MRKTLQDKYIIVRGVGGNYWVHALDDPEREIQVNAPGILRKQKIKPLVGDLVECEKTEDELIPLSINKILDRKNELPRPPIANIDLLWLVIPLMSPETDLNVLDKMLIFSELQGIKCEIIFSKYDLAKERGETLARIYSDISYVTYLSEKDDNALHASLRQKLAGKLVCLAGPSGAGKSTLLNNLLGENLMNIGEVSEKSKRGKHTTRHVELFSCLGGYLSDTPGFTSLELNRSNIEGADIARAYPEFRELAKFCKYNSCKHINEPDCAVLESGNIDAGRLERYQKFRKSIDATPKYDRR